MSFIEKVGSSKLVVIAMQHENTKGKLCEPIRVYRLGIFHHCTVDEASCRQ